MKEFDLDKLKEAIDPKDPKKALKYLGETITREQMYTYIVNKIIDQKDNECVYMPMPTIYNLFMSFIQDMCDEPYKLLSDIIQEKPNLEIKKLKELETKEVEIVGPVAKYLLNKFNLEDYDDFRKKYIDTDFEYRWYPLFVKYILEKNNGTAKKFELLSPFYAPKNSTSDYDLFAPEDFEVIDDYQFADERDK